MKWVKRTGLEVAVIGAVAAAGYAIDELTNQVMTINRRDLSGYYAGYYVDLNGGGIIPSGQYLSVEEAFNSAPATINTGSRIYTKSHFTTQNAAVVGYIYYTWTYSDLSGGGTQSFQVSRVACAGAAICDTPPEQIEQYEPAPFEDVWELINPIADAHPEALRDWATDPAGNPYIYPEVAAEHAKIVDSAPVTGAPYLPDAVVSNDPLEGQGLDPTGYPTGEPSPTPEVVSETPPLELPTDYARENTLGTVRDYMLDAKNYLESLKKLMVDGKGVADPDKPEDYDYSGETFDNLLTGMTGVADPPDLDFMPTLPRYSSGCQTLTLSYGGHSVVFPNNSQCDKLGDAKNIIAYMLYVLTAFGIAQVVLTPRGS
jgi:hypothetical protein